MSASPSAPRPSSTPGDQVADVKVAGHTVVGHGRVDRHHADLARRHGTSPAGRTGRPCGPGAGRARGSGRWWSSWGHSARWSRYACSGPFPSRPCSNAYSDLMRARAPASSANLGPGFDALAVALDCYVQVEVEPAGSLRVHSEGEGAGLCDDASHLAVRVASSILGHDRIAVTVRSQIPVSRGLGFVGRTGCGRGRGGRFRRPVLRRGRAGRSSRECGGERVRRARRGHRWSTVVPVRPSFP